MSSIIQDITLNKVASYKESTKIEDLKKLNFFFGSNGTGKSIIGKYLQALNIAEDKSNVKNFEKCSLTGYNLDEHEIIVFNQQFIEKNFISTNDMPGIFTLDKRNKEIEEEIKKEQDKIKKWDECLEKLNTKNISLSDAKTQIYSGANGVLEKCWNLRNDFNRNFQKMPPLEHSRSKENHFNKINLILKTEEKQNTDYQSLLSDYRNLYEKKIVEIEQSFDTDLYSEITRLETEINTKLANPFTGNKDVDIANMIDTLGIQRWVEERWNQLDKSISPQKCPFCQKETINRDLIQQFEDYFDRSYQENKDAIQNLKTQYNDFAKQLISNLNSIEPGYPEETDLNQLINKLEKFFENQDRVIQNKLDYTNEKLSITSLNKYIKDLKKVIRVIASNNEDFENLKEKRQELIQNIWKYMSFRAKEPIKEYETEKNKIEKKLKQINDIKTYLFENKIQKSQSLIEEKRKDTANTDTAKDEINKTLKSTGFHGFLIDKKGETENKVPKYYLERPNEKNDNVFSTLSEGEKNFIAFLYFYWLCKGTDDQKNKKNKKKIIVIDDPVSSLDSQALFIVTTLIRELAKKKETSTFFNEFISQIFVLSHNLYFYNEVSLNSGYKDICQNINHYQISKCSNKSLVSSGTKDSKIENDYNLMWRSLFELKKQKGFNIAIGNLMRRIIQSYLQFTHNHHKERVSYKRLTDTTKKMLYDAFVSQINKESHHLNPMEELNFQRVSGFNSLDHDTLFEVFEMLLKDIGAENHYQAMLENHSRT